MVINLTKPAEVDTSALILPEEITKVPLKQNALVMAMFGWAKDDNDAAVQMVKCDACFRRLGLWLFVKRPGSADDDGDEFSSMSRLNVVEEHRDVSCTPDIRWVPFESVANSSLVVVLSMGQCSVPDRRPYRLGDFA